jgi:hypothetical protein
MIDAKTLLKFANKSIKTAINDSWHGRGKLTFEGELRQKTIYADDGTKLGEATLGFFSFEKPIGGFVGIVVAAMPTTNGIISEANPVIDKLEEDDFSNHDLENHFCPRCHQVNSLKHKERKLSTECVEITTTCTKCFFKDVNVID